MSLEQITEQMRTRVGASAGLKKSVKFDFGSDGVVRIDDSVAPAVVDNADTPTDCTVKVAMSDFMDMASGKQNPDGVHDGQAQGRRRHVGGDAAG